MCSVTSWLPLAELFHIAVFSKCPLVTQSGYQKIPVSSSQLLSVVATLYTTNTSL